MRAAAFLAIDMVRSTIDTAAVHCLFVRACPMIRAASETALGLGPDGDELHADLRRGEHRPPIAR